MDLKVFFLLGWLTTSLPAEPPEQYLISERYDGTSGFYFREYSIESHGKVNYITMRRIVQVVPIDDDAIHADTLPLFYWYDYNGDGVFSSDETWIDPEEHGSGIHQYNYQDQDMRY